MIEQVRLVEFGEELSNFFRGYSIFITLHVKNLQCKNGCRVRWGKGAIFHCYLSFKLPNPPGCVELDAECSLIQCQDKDCIQLCCTVDSPYHFYRSTLVLKRLLKGAEVENPILCLPEILEYFHLEQENIVQFFVDPRGLDSP